MRIGLSCPGAMLMSLLVYAQAKAEQFNDGDGAAWRPVMVAVPGGAFTMGSPEGEAGRQRVEAQHQVTIAPFAAGKFPGRR